MTRPVPIAGLQVRRRAVLYLPALAVLGALPPGRAGGEGAPGFDFEAFAKACGELAKNHLEGGRVDPEVYLHGLAGLAAQVDPKGVPRPELGDFGGYDPPIGIAPVHRGPPIVVIEWKLAPNAFLPPHNHTPGYVYSLCLEGACWVRHFEIVGDAPAPGTDGKFQMRKTQARLMRPGTGTSLTPERDNIHTFQAGPEGALGIDINTFWPGEGDWSMLEYEEGKREGFEKLYEARWIGKPGKK